MSKKCEVRGTYISTGQSLVWTAARIWDHVKIWRFISLGIVIFQNPENPNKGRSFGMRSLSFAVPVGWDWTRSPSAKTHILCLANVHLLRCHNELFGYQIQWAIIIHTADAGLTQLLPGHVNEWFDVYCLQKRKARKKHTPCIRGKTKRTIAFLYRFQETLAPLKILGEDLWCASQELIFIILMFGSNISSSIWIGWSQKMS